MIVTVPEGSIKGIMQCMENDRIVKQIPIGVGKNSLIPPENKREGDKCTPEGTYAVRRGLWREADVQTLFPMQKITPQMIWIDDSSLPTYNTLVEDDGSQLNGHGERLIDMKICYRYILVVEYNTSPIVPGKGSAIFIHAWYQPNSSSAGCIVMSPEDIQWLIGWIRPDTDAHITIKHDIQ